MSNPPRTSTALVIAPSAEHYLRWAKASGCVWTRCVLDTSRLERRVRGTCYVLDEPLFGEAQRALVSCALEHGLTLVPVRWATR